MSCQENLAFLHPKVRRACEIATDQGLNVTNTEGSNGYACRTRVLINGHLCKIQVLKYVNNHGFTIFTLSNIKNPCEFVIFHVQTDTQETVFVIPQSELSTRKNVGLPVKAKSQRSKWLQYQDNWAHLSP
jgi:hypothetical protein